LVDLEVVGLGVVAVLARAPAGVEAGLRDVHVVGRAAVVALHAAKQQRARFPTGVGRRVVAPCRPIADVVGADHAVGRTGVGAAVPRVHVAVVAVLVAGPHEAVAAGRRGAGRGAVVGVVHVGVVAVLVAGPHEAVAAGR